MAHHYHKFTFTASFFEIFFFEDWSSEKFPKASWPNEPSLFSQLSPNNIKKTVYTVFIEVFWRR